jgi:PAS domain S-box-containing protein
VAKKVLKILLVEDNAGDVVLLREELRHVRNLRLEMTHVETLAEAVSRLENESFDIILLDLSLPDSFGLAGLTILESKRPTIPIIVLTGLEDDELASQAVRQGAQDYLTKGHNSIDLLVRAMLYAVERKQAMEELHKVNRCLKVLSESNHALVLASEETEFLQRICTILVKHGGYLAAWVGYAQNDESKTVLIKACAGKGIETIRSLTITWDESLSGQGPTGMAIRTGRYQIMKNVSEDIHFQFWKAFVRDKGILSVISLPFPVPNKERGVLTIISSEPDAFKNDEIRLLMELADDVAYGIQTIRTREDHQLAEKALLGSNALLEKIFASVHLLIAYMDSRFNFIRVNALYANADGHDSAYYVGKNHFDLYPNEENQKIFQKVVATGEAYYAYEKPFEYAYNPERGISYWDWSLLPIKGPDGSVNGLVLSMFDVTNRKRLEMEILEISRREQRRIGQDLHDVLGQNLTGLSFLAKVLERKLAERCVPEMTEAGKIAKLSNQAVNQARALARGLCPVDLKADGLMTALQDFSFNLENLFGITCYFVCKTPILIHDNVKATHLYHIVQEAVNNALKHGKATLVTIDLSAIDDRITLTVEDNGTGLPMNLEKNKGMGLHIMDYRARMIGASFDVRPGASQGTIVTCAFRNVNLHNREEQR